MRQVHCLYYDKQYQNDVKDMKIKHFLYFFTKYCNISESKDGNSHSYFYNKSLESLLSYWWSEDVYEWERQLLDMIVQPTNMFPLPAGNGIIHHFLRGLLQRVTLLRPHQWQQGQICNVRLSLLRLPLLRCGHYLQSLKRPAAGQLGSYFLSSHQLTADICWDRGRWKLTARVRKTRGLKIHSLFHWFKCLLLNHLSPKEFWSLIDRIKGFKAVKKRLFSERTQCFTMN